MIQMTALALVTMLVLADMRAQTECEERARGTSDNGWERAKRVHDGGFCAIIASAETKLSSGTPLGLAQARLLADQAAALRAESALPHVVRGRAAMRERKFDEARRELMQATTAAPSLLRDPDVLFAAAHSSVALGASNEARDLYARLLPWSSALSRPDQSLAMTEAGFLFMRDGVDGLDAAIVAFREVRSTAPEQLRGLAALGLALALDRKGAKDESDSLLTPAVRTSAPAIVKQGGEAKIFSQEEEPALLAVALEGIDARAAREQWGRIVAGPFKAHAEAHLRAKSEKPKGAR